MNNGYYIFMFFWIGMPILLLLVTIMLFIMDRKVKKKAIEEEQLTGIKKTRLTKIFFIIFLIIFILYAAISIGFGILATLIVKNM